jgi:hypothetical protein
MPFSTRTSACTGLANLARREVQELTPNRHARGSYPLKKLSAAIVIQMVIGFALAGVLRAQSSAPLAPSASEINQKVTGAFTPTIRRLESWEPRPRGSWSSPTSRRGHFLSAHSLVSERCEKVAALQDITGPLPHHTASRRGQGVWLRALFRGQLGIRLPQPERRMGARLRAEHRGP